MMEYLDYSEPELKQKNAWWTAKEISQQPECWKKVHQNIETLQPEIRAFLDIALAADNVRIIMTGAGTSAFAGRALAPMLSKLLKKRIDAVATTDLVSNPQQYLAEDVPVLLVSFARSGNSPESVAALDIAETSLSHCFHLVLTCNPQGQLYRYCQNNDKALAILMPEESNDQSLAMTSSFSSMLMAAVSIFGGLDIFPKYIEPFYREHGNLYPKINEIIRQQYAGKFNRVIYLGSGGFQGLAQEASLKMLEMTAGKVIAAFDSPLGFRHGPKAIVNKQTLIVLFISNDPYTRQYDLDLLKELLNDDAAGLVITITAKESDSELSNNIVYLPNMENSPDISLLFPYLMIAQSYAFHSSIMLGHAPDNPSPSGEINRVVKGVTIYPFKKD
ncbi:SIS domain-containing protein [Moellerella wisconsensis]|uniref:SIS domain-containing protein n=1 Tax=Moellerella wisconsensis TaxID=158849 RepID=UPI001F4EAC4F|nr:SIS domain-containing protein [Moellerella wisconsensis]UNH28868.1 SIS domain-containing protein [Moellerella wisconsensis]